MSEMRDMYLVVDTGTGEVFHIGRTKESCKAPEAAAKKRRHPHVATLVNRSDLEALTPTALLRVYNTVAGTAIRRFETRATGLARLWKFIRPINHNASVDQKEARRSKPAAASGRSKASRRGGKAGGATGGDKAPARRRVPKAGSASQMFQDLIMAGGLSDDKIFALVQKKFALDDKKRGYVAWYRSYLRKQGENPPDPIAD